MAGLIFYFGNVGRLFKNGTYELQFSEGHTDPDFVHWTLGANPDKPSKAHLGDLKKGDFIFFVAQLESLTKNERAPYFVGFMRIVEIISIKELIEKYSKLHLWVLHPYCYNGNIQQLLNSNKKKKKVKENQKLTLFVGNSSKSKLIAKNPIPLDRSVFRDIFNRFDPNETPNNGRYNWYYNEPGYADTFGKRKNKNGDVLSDERIINAKFRIPPLLPDYLADYMQEQMKKKEEGDAFRRLKNIYSWQKWYNSHFREILSLPDHVWKDLSKESFVQLFKILPDELAYTLISDLVAKDLEFNIKAYLFQIRSKYEGESPWYR